MSFWILFHGCTIPLNPQAGAQSAGIGLGTGVLPIQVPEPTKCKECGPVLGEVLVHLPGRGALEEGTRPSHCSTGCVLSTGPGTGWVKFKVKLNCLCCVHVHTCVWQIKRVSFKSSVYFYFYNITGLLREKTSFDCTSTGSQNTLARSLSSQIRPFILGSGHCILSALTTELSDSINCSVLCH